MEEKKWYRVIDPLNPLYGSDVTGVVAVEDDAGSMLAVSGMRRVDVFVGDRPFQLVAPEGDDLGIWVSMAHLDESPIQDETVELVSDRPFGICVDESEMTRADGLTLRIARYETATQMAVSDMDDELLATRTFGSDSRTPDSVLDMFERGDDQDDIVYLLRRSE